MSSFSVRYDEFIECRLCPHFCRIREGKTGICGVRKNTGKEIELTTYEVISGKSLDPVEKKPLYHFFPGYNILSVGSYGCNMRCDFCQNWHISQDHSEVKRKNCTIDHLVQEATKSSKNIGLAFTYNEPVIWFEFMRDTALKIKEYGMHTVMVSNGYVSREPLNEILSFIDAFNIDLKAFNESFYKKLTGADLKTVKESLKTIATKGRHLEITTLIIPGRNDSVNEMDEEARWIAGELGTGIPLHLSRYFPMYKRDDPVTPQPTLDKLFETASSHLKYVYLGNTSTLSGQDTVCPECGTEVTRRSGYSIKVLNLDSEGRCIKCGDLIYRNFIFSR
jgi:pyruvate formate lyase activating enzyme